MTTTNTHVTIKGLIALDPMSNKPVFLTDWQTEWFENGEHMGYVLLAEHTIEVEVPSVDLTRIRLAALDAQEADMTAKYQAAKTEIQTKRQNLLALEFEGA